MKVMRLRCFHLRFNNYKSAFSCITKKWNIRLFCMNFEASNVKSTNKLTVKEILTLKPIEQEISVQGWIRAIRKHKKIIFMDINDGSCIESLQVIDEERDKKISFGCSVKIEGILLKSTHENQEVELKCNSLIVLGKCDALEYPFHARHNLSVKETRQHLHLRPRTKNFSSLLRIRSTATFAIHKFFQERNFFHVNSPILTSNDCEGGGDVFSIQTVTQNIPNENSSKNEDSSKTESMHYFDFPVYLTVSGQLALEAAACALSKVYTFGPTFRAENNRTRRHLSEFQMIEVEQAFVSLDELLQLTEELFKVSSQYIIEKCAKDVELFHSYQNPSYIYYMKEILEKPFIRLSYSEAVDILQKNKKFINKDIKWGEKLYTEHEEFLLKYHDDNPVFIKDFPVNITPFYMKMSSAQTASCFDLIAPYGGEICGGSLREDDESQLKNRIDKAGIDVKPLQWYIELRQFGSVPHGGFGMGFDRFLQTILAIPNIREVVPFPRWSYNCQM